MSTVGKMPVVFNLDGSRPGTKEVLGGKAYSVNRMRALGLPVPPAFALPTHVCGIYHDNGRALPDDVWHQVVDAVHELESDTGRTFGSGPSPLLVSVRSGAAQSMPGMMDTVLNLGLTPELVEVLVAESGDPDWAADTWTRFRRSYAEIVVGSADHDSSVEPPADAFEQLRAAIGAVFDSWTNDRVRAYRDRHQLGSGTGTAVTVQAMVFGNRDEQSGTGVMFSRDPGTGEPVLYGEWLANAQGEDVVSGEKTPQPLSSLRDWSPESYAALEEVAVTLEGEHRDLVDIEFTVESGRLFMLQCRSGKRSPQAAVRVAADLATEGVIDAKEALSRITEEQVESLAGAKSIDDDGRLLADGLGACPGVATGYAARDEADVQTHLDAGHDVVLVRRFTAPDDVPAMFQSVGVVTEVGGATSHAALVCREIGLPCVVGVGDGVVADLVGQVVTVDGAAGRVYAGDATGVAAVADDPHVQTLLGFLTATGMSDHPLARIATTNV